MTSIITGDIVHSQMSNPGIWMDLLKQQFLKSGSSPYTWEIYRGDSFQLEVVNPANALETAILIKASIKCIKNIDVRMAIGIGNKNFDSGKITESNGSAFIFSGEQFEKLIKEKQNLAIASESKSFDRDINFCLRLALTFMDNWSENSAEIVKVVLENPGLSQEEIGERLGIKQNSVSTRLKRAHFNEVMELIQIYQIKLKEQL